MWNDHHPDYPHTSFTQAFLIPLVLLRSMECRRDDAGVPDSRLSLNTPDSSYQSAECSDTGCHRKSHAVQTKQSNRTTGEDTLGDKARERLHPSVAEKKDADHACVSGWHAKRPSSESTAGKCFERQVVVTEQTNTFASWQTPAASCVAFEQAR